MSYGDGVDDLFRRAAVYVDKILKGAKPADLPVQQATKFEFVINLKAAKQIGLTIPGRVLERANQGDQITVGLIELSYAISCDIILKRRSVQSYAELAFSASTNPGSSSVVNNTFLNFRLRDKKPQERGTQ